MVVVVEGVAGGGILQVPLSAFKMANAEKLVCVPSMDILMNPLFCLLCLLVLGNTKVNVNLHTLQCFLLLVCN